MTKDKPKLLSGENPQIPKGYGDGPVQDYIAATPGWKQGVVRELDRIISDAVPGALKAVKWNSPMYGIEEDRYFLSFHCMTRYVKVAFFSGAALTPPPPEPSKQPDVRYFHVTEDAPFDKDQFTDWVRQASRLPGTKM